MDYLGMDQTAVAWLKLLIIIIMIVFFFNRHFFKHHLTDSTCWLRRCLLVVTPFENALDMDDGSFWIWFVSYSINLALAYTLDQVTKDIGKGIWKDRVVSVAIEYSVV